MVASEYCGLQIRTLKTLGAITMEDRNSCLGFTSKQIDYDNTHTRNIEAIAIFSFHKSS
jgi:hypothetical protein